MHSNSTTGLSSLPLAGVSTVVANRELIGDVISRARKANWETILVRADRAVCVAGAAMLILSAAYFAPILVSILSR